ncbi:TRAP transporter permease [Mesorhizobium sp. M0808]|uniref:TRAP transporter large permease subunit n=1 Tax=Mesorhizobium sp. M0808 TaxID=2957002 RepID=UPI00333D3645
MVMWIFFGATMFVGFFILKGGQTFVSDSILGTGLVAYGVLILMMVILFVLGMFLDWVGILLLTVPPILKRLQFDGLFAFRVWPPATCRSGTASSSWSHADGLSSARLSAIRFSI